MRSLRKSLKAYLRIPGVLLVLPLLLLAGCDGFFFKPTTGSGTGTGTGTGTSTTNYVFVANAGANTVTGSAISSTGTLTGLRNSPINLGYAPTTLTVSRDNRFLWVGTVSQILGYSIASDGTLTALKNGQALVNAFCVDMQTSPDGRWLMVLDGSGNAIDLFSIGSDGSLTVGTNGGLGFTANGTVVPRQLRISPTGSFVVAAMGTAGELVFAFNTTTGVLTQLTQTLPPSLTSDNGIAIDNTGLYLYEARSGNASGLVVNTISSNGALTPTTATVYAAGSQPYSVTLDNTGKYVYVGNRGDSNISAWSIGTNAALTALADSPYASGNAVTALVADSSGKYVLAAAYGGSPDLTVYGFDTSVAGKLKSVTSTATGANAIALALSH